MKHFFHKPGLLLWRALVDVFFPRVCLACGERLHTDEFLCGRCRGDVPLTRFWKLRENPMAESFNELIQRNMGQNTKYQPYGYAAALFYYKGGFREITKSLKYRRGFRVGRHFARELGKKLKESPLFADVDLLCRCRCIGCGDGGEGTIRRRSLRGRWQECLGYPVTRSCCDARGIRNPRRIWTPQAACATWPEPSGHGASRSRYPPRVISFW